MGPLEVSPEAFNWEEEECLLDGDGECGRGHRCGAGPETDPPPPGLCRAVGPGRTQPKGMLEAGSLGLSPISTVLSCVWWQIVQPFCFTVASSIKWECNSTYLRGSCKD